MGDCDGIFVWATLIRVCVDGILCNKSSKSNGIDSETLIGLCRDVILSVSSSKSIGIEMTCSGDVAGYVLVL